MVKQELLFLKSYSEIISDFISSFELLRC